MSNDIQDDADEEQRRFLMTISHVRGLTDDQLLIWVEQGSHGDAAFAEQQFRNLRELKAIHGLLREAVALLLKLTAK